MHTEVNVQNLGKHYGPIKAVDGISFSVQKGEVLGFLGPNGAGKTTTMKMLTCFLTPSFGTANICGFDILEKSIDVRRIVGYIPESAPSYDDMNVKSFLEFIADIRGYDGSERKKRVTRVVEITNLSSVLSQDIETLSKGYRRRVSLAQALIHDPPVLILDEPTDGLDPNQKHEVRTLIKDIARDKVIILSTHILEEVDAVCSRAIIISSGKIVANESPTELRRRSRYAGSVEIAIRTEEARRVHDILQSIPQVQEVETLSNDAPLSHYLAIPAKGAKIDEDILKLAKERDWKIESFSIEKGRLDEVFRSITGGGLS